MSALLLSLLAIAAAPLLDRGARGHPRVQAFVDGLIQTVVGGILLVHVLPFGLATAGWPALFALGAGAMAAVVAHRIPGGERSAGALAVLALLLHSGVDGAALAAPDEHAEHAGEGLLAWAVVLHTVPVALATWRISRKAAGAWFAAGLLAATGLVTLGGWWATGQVLHGTSPAALGLAQCAAAGALLHVLGHVGDRHQGSAPGWGALTGVAVVGLLAWSHPIPRTHIEELGAGTTFLRALLSAAPALIAGYVLIGILHALGPKTLGFWLAKGSRLGEAARGALVGLPVPVCSCGALEAYTGVIARGAAPATALAFLVAGPEIGVGTVLVSLPLLGVDLTIVRLVAAFGVAMVVGLFVGPSVRSAESPRLPARTEGTLAAARFGLIETVDHTAPWILAGLGIAALAEPLLAADVLSGLPAGLGVVLAATVGVPAYVCASGATPLVALLLHKGLSTGAAVAFLLTGPALNVATFAMLRRLHGGRVATLVGLVVTAAAIGVGLLVDQLSVASAPELHATFAPGALEWGAAAALVALFAASLVRNGAGGFLEPLLHPHAHTDTDAPKTPHSHTHAHGHHHHGHDHGGHDHRHTPDHGA